MVYAENLSQPSLVELARTGDFRAISYMLNSYLSPQGILAQVGADQKQGCLRVLVEFQQEPVAEGIIKSICHLLWKINSPTVEGVRIMARFMGEADILWKQSVRIVTPANQFQQRSFRQPFDRIKFKTFRIFMLMGSTLTSFILGCWVSYYEVMAQYIPQSRPVSEDVVVTAPPRNPVDTVQAALETISVVRHDAVQRPYDPTVTLMFGGDVTLSDQFETVVGDDYEWAFDKLPEYRSADIAMVNLEAPLTRSTLRRPNKQFNFKADPNAVKVLTHGGIDIVNLANNHTMDYEEPGLVETLETLEKAGIHSVGAGRDLKEARRPEILEVKGQRIAYFGYYDANFHAAGEGTPGTNPLHDEHQQRVAEDIRAIRDQVDWVIVNYHWGVELSEYPANWQIELAHATIDQGADLVVGHHPHVLQGAEIYNGRPIVYSLGNFIFGGHSRTDYNTAVLKVSLKANRKMKVEFLPVQVKQYQAKVVLGRAGDEILETLKRLSRIFDQPMQFPMILDEPQPSLKPVDVSPTQTAVPRLPQLETSAPPEASAEPENPPRFDENTVILPPKLKALTQLHSALQSAVELPMIQKNPLNELSPDHPSEDPSEDHSLKETSQRYNNSSHSISFSLSGTQPVQSQPTQSKVQTQDRPKKPTNEARPLVDLPVFNASASDAESLD